MTASVVHLTAAVRVVTAENCIDSIHKNKKRQTNVGID